MSLITALTIGYGDVIPHTPMGKIISIIVGFTGLVFVGLSVAIAARGFKEDGKSKMSDLNTLRASPKTKHCLT
ncbi:MAG: hypothetical protein K940chlam9_01197 [Chlamydiae bacterium]|nr:hypothetical protein [Chlamydiota bacterium]